jgi:hypothetical protein
MENKSHVPNHQPTDWNDGFGAYFFGIFVGITMVFSEI